MFGFWPLEKVDLSVDTLQAAMRARSVTRSLAYSAKALFYDAGEGNDDTVAVCAQRPELLPVAVLDPRAYPACLEEARKRLAQGVKVFRLFPDRHGYPIDFAPAAELLAELAGQVVIVTTGQMGVPTALARLVADTGCRTILDLDFGSAAGRSTGGPAPHRLPGDDDARHRARGRLEAAVKVAGAARLIFASGSPLYSLGSALMSVQFASLSDGDRNSILGENITRLLAGQR